MTDLQDPILWLDLETDGNKWHNGLTLEIGCVLTDGLDRHVDELDVVINPELCNWEPELIFQNMPKVVQKMHTDTGLWLECLEAAHDERSAARAVLVWLQSHGMLTEETQEGTITWGGKGVAPFDGPWLEHRMPELHRWLRYWALDVSPIRRIGQIAGVSEPEFFTEGETVHRAVDDARNAWRAARWWRDTIYASRNPGQFPRMEKKVKS